MTNDFSGYEQFFEGLGNLAMDHPMREVLLYVHQSRSFQVGNEDPVDYLTEKLSQKFPNNSRNERLDSEFRSAAYNALQKRYIIFDDEYGVVRLNEFAETSLKEMDIIYGSFGASKVRHIANDQYVLVGGPYCWYSGGLL